MFWKLIFCSVSCANSPGKDENGHTNIFLKSLVNSSNGVEKNGARPTTSKGKVKIKLEICIIFKV